MHSRRLARRICHHFVFFLLIIFSSLCYCSAPEAGIRRNLRLAVTHLKRAAEAGFANAHSNLAAIYLSPTAEAAAAAASAAKSAKADDGEVRDDAVSADHHDDDDTSVAYNASAARFHLEQAIAAGDFPPAHFNLAIIDYHGLDAAETADAKADGESSGAGAEKRSKRQRQASDSADHDADDADDNHIPDDEEDDVIAEDEAAHDAAAAAPRGNCSAALKRWLGVAFRGRWLQTSPLSFQSAYHSFEASSADENRWGFAGTASGGLLRRFGSLLPGFIRKQLVGGAATSEDADDAVLAARISISTGPAPLHVAALQYLTLSAIGIPAAQDNAAFLLRGSTLLSPLEAAALLHAPAVLAQPLNDTLPFAVAARLYDSGVADSTSASSPSATASVPASISQLVHSRTGSTGANMPSLAGFMFDSLPPATVPAAATAGRASSSDAAALAAFPQAVAEHAAYQLARLSARAGSAFAPKLVGDCFAEGWAGVTECAAAAAAAQRSGFTGAAGSAAHAAPADGTDSSSTSTDRSSTSAIDASARAPVHPAVVWYERAAAAGLGHAAFRLAELAAGLGAGKPLAPTPIHAGQAADASTQITAELAGSRNVTAAWETMYRVGAVDWLGDWPVFLTRIRLVVTWVAEQVSAVAVGSVDDAAAAAARLHDTIADLAGCALSWPPPLPEVDEDGHSDADGDNDDAADQDHHGADDAGTTDGSSKSANAAAGASGGAAGKKRSDKPPAAAGGHTPRSAFSAAARDAAEAVAAQQQELYQSGSDGDSVNGAAVGAGGSGGSGANSSQTLSAADPVRKAMEDALAQRARLLQQERYHIGPWPLDWESRWACSLWAHSLVLGVWTGAGLLAAGVAGVAASAVFVR